VNPDRADPDITELLGGVGQVDPPASGALETARETLWSAVADEMLFTAEANARKREREAEQPQPTARRNRPGRSQQSEQRRRAGDPGS
jgi:hypothetical protein